MLQSNIYHQAYNSRILLILVEDEYRITSHVTYWPVFRPTSRLLILNIYIEQIEASEREVCLIIFIKADYNTVYMGVSKEIRRGEN